MAHIELKYRLQPNVGWWATEYRDGDVHGGVFDEPMASAESMREHLDRYADKLRAKGHTVEFERRRETI